MVGALLLHGGANAMIPVQDVAGHIRGLGVGLMVPVVVQKEWKRPRKRHSPDHTLHRILLGDRLAVSVLVAKQGHQPVHAGTFSSPALAKLKKNRKSVQLINNLPAKHARHRIAQGGSYVERPVELLPQKKLVC